MSVWAADGEDQSLGAELCSLINQVGEAVTVQINAPLIKGDEAITVGELGQDAVGLSIPHGIDITLKRAGLEWDLLESKMAR
jgi:hypothetical protein